MRILLIDFHPLFEDVPTTQPEETTMRPTSIPEGEQQSLPSSVQQPSTSIQQEEKPSTSTKEDEHQPRTSIMVQDEGLSFVDDESVGLDAIDLVEG
jgi:hypothetical protein